MKFDHQGESFKILIVLCSPVFRLFAFLFLIDTLARCSTSKFFIQFFGLYFRTCLAMFILF